MKIVTILKKKLSVKINRYWFCYHACTLRIYDLVVLEINASW